MFYHTTINKAKAFFTIGFINQMNKKNGGYFWTRSTNRFFGDSTRNWKTFVMDDGNVFICQKSTGKVRQVLADYSIGCPLQTTIDGAGYIVMVDDKRQFNGLYEWLKECKSYGEEPLIKSEPLFQIV